MSIFDKTFKDTTRRDINLRENQIESVLPSHILSEYPKFVSFIKAYFDFEDKEDSLTRFLNNMFETRDVTQTDLDLLTYF
jgi:predicted transcriptional regulator